MPKAEKWFDRDFEEKVYSYFRGRVPDKVFDAHMHISKGEIPGVADSDLFRKEIETAECMLGKGKIKGALVMGNPKLFKNKESYDDEMTFAFECSKDYPGQFVNALIVRPEDNPGDVESWLKKYPSIAAIKVYWVYGKSLNCETDILEFAPEWIWEIADKHSLAVVLHLSHDSMGLNHPKNIEELHYVSKKYPNAKIQLAHCGMGHNPYMFKKGLEQVLDIDNMYIDLSGIAEPLTYMYTFKYFDRKKLLFAIDGYNFAFNNLGKCFGIGKGFMGVHTGENIPAVAPADVIDYPYRFGGVTPAAESMLALFAAGDMIDLHENEWEDVFYNNAVEFYGLGSK